MVGAMAVPLRRAGTAVFALILAASATPTRHAAAAPGAWEWLSTRQGPGQFYDPVSPATGPGEVLYVADGMGNQVQRRDAEGTWTIVAPLGDQPGEVRGPISLSVSGDGTLYVLERGNLRIQARKPDGTWQVVAYPAVSGPKPSPVALAAQPDGTLYLVDGMHNSADESQNKYTLWTRTPNGEWTETGDTWPREQDRLVPVALAADPQGGLYVAETPAISPSGARVSHRSPSGEWMVVAPSGSNLGTVGQLEGLAASSKGDLYVADRVGLSLRLQKRDAQGTWTSVPSPVADYGSHGSLAAGGDGSLYLASYSDGAVWLRSPSGTWSQIGATSRAPGQMTFGPLWDVDPAGRVYLGQSSGGQWHKLDGGSIEVVSSNDTIDVRSPGGLWSRAASSGSAVGQVFELVGVAASPSGELYAAEMDPLSRLQKRASDGAWSYLGPSGPLGGFNIYSNASSITADAQGNLWVAEAVLVSTAEGMRLSKRSPAGEWTTLISDRTGLHTQPHALPDGKGGCYLWSSEAALSDPTQNPWAQHFDGTSWQDLQDLGSVRELGLGPKGELYVALRDTGELWQVSSQGERVKLAAPGWELGQVAPDLQAIRADSFGRVYLCSRAGVQRYTPPSALVRGDVDGDGQVAIADALYALKVLAGLTEGTPTVELRGDVWPSGGGDGKLSIADVARLLRYLAGLEPTV